MKTLYVVLIAIATGLVGAIGGCVGGVAIGGVGGAMGGMVAGGMAGACLAVDVAQQEGVLDEAQAGAVLVGAKERIDTAIAAAAGEGNTPEPMPEIDCAQILNDLNVQP